MATRKATPARKPAPAKKKRPKTGGRKAGTPNKVTAAVKEALTEAFDRLGGVPALVAWARLETTEFYKLWSKMLPAEVKATVDGTVRLELVEEIIDPHAPADDPAAPAAG